MSRFDLTRRTMLTGTLAASIARPADGPAIAQPAKAGTFTHDVASGDPLATRVILWTRFLPTTGGDATIFWEIATDAGFEQIVKRGTARALAAQDHIVKVDAGGLKPNTKYAYRFHAGDAVSPIGETRTLPVGDISSVTFAVFSCSNLPFGYFQAYAHAAARTDIDFALHLGDYIYEYQNGTYPSKAQAIADRPHDPGTEIVSLADYRKRYANYRADPDLQKIHRKLPFIVVWDDHELTNDAWKNGAENHQPETEGAWDARVRAARQAYSEWMPIRDQRNGKIYRRFDFGSLASLIMLDTRSIGRDKQMDYQQDLRMKDVSPRPEELSVVAAAFRKKWADPKRSMLGTTQEKWLAAQLKNSAAKNIRWQVIGQQLQSGFLKTPRTLPNALPANAPDWLRKRVELGALMSTQNLPANLDAWNGYPAARDRLIKTLRSHANNAIVLAGDTHNAWLFELDEKPDGTLAAVEFGGHSVSSPGYESAVRIPPETLQQMLIAENVELKWCNTWQRGYMVTRLTAEAATNDWIFLASVREPKAAIAAIKTVRVPATNGKGTAKAILA
jgi:alkaline phosphatase D